MIDFHCHLDLYPEPQAFVDQCVARRVEALCVTTTPSAWRKTSGLGRGSPLIRTAVGLHPQLAHERKSELPLLESLLRETQFVGEVGLDGSPELRSTWNDQTTAFLRILKACAGAGGRILSIHSRRAATPVLDALEANAEAGIPILHWFSGNPRELDRAVSMGCWFSIGPSMLASEKGRALAARMPLDRLLTESDGPFAQIDGRQAVPWDVGLAVDQLAALRAKTQSEISGQLTSNLDRLVTGPSSRVGARTIPGLC